MHDTTSFHPGYYIAEIIEDTGVIKSDFASRLGIPEETLDKLLDGQIGLSDDIAEKLSAIFGSSVEFWRNLQTAYDNKIKESEEANNADVSKYPAKSDLSFVERDTQQ